VTRSGCRACPCARPASRADSNRAAVPAFLGSRPRARCSSWRAWGARSCGRGSARVPKRRPARRARALRTTRLAGLGRRAWVESIYSMRIQRRAASHFHKLVCGGRRQILREFADGSRSRVSKGRHYFDCGGTILACFDPHADGDGYDPSPNPDHVYFAVDDLETVHVLAKSAGCLTIDPAISTRPWGERSFYATDPFGNPICFVDAATAFTGGKFVD